MTTDIFIRTCAKDLQWLQLALRSIKERVTGYRNIVITCPAPVAIRISRATGLNVFGVNPFHDDYVGQMHTKLKATDYSDAMATRLETEKALVPALWQLELANVLKTACTKGRLTQAQARQILDALNQLPIEVDTAAPPGQRQLFELAMRYNLSSYDAAYLELAMRHGLPLATQDEQLKLAATAAGVDVVQPSS